MASSCRYLHDDVIVINRFKDRCWQPRYSFIFRMHVGMIRSSWNTVWTPYWSSESSVEKISHGSTDIYTTYLSKIQHSNNDIHTYKLTYIHTYIYYPHQRQYEISAPLETNSMIISDIVSMYLKSTSVGHCIYSIYVVHTYPCRHFDDYIY